MRGKPRVALTLPLLALVAVGLAAACGPSHTQFDPAAADTPWRSQTLALTVKGFVLAGEEAKEAEWGGTGVWMAPGLLVTNAHVALRGLEIEAKDDLGAPFRVDRIVALDPRRDLALLRAVEETDVMPTTLVARPENPADLRGERVLVIGNTGGLGLARYEGLIINVASILGAEHVLTDAAIAGGASGGPLYLFDSGDMVGLSHSVSPTLRLALAVPAWDVQRLATAAGESPGVPLGDVFQPTAAPPMEEFARDQGCLPPGKGGQFPIQLVGPTDLVLGVKVSEDEREFAFGLVSGETVLMEGTAAGQLIRAYTMPGSGVVTFVVGNPSETEPLCAEVVVARLAWEQRMP